MCNSCKWADAANKAEEVADALPSYQSKKREFLESVAETITEKRHVTDRQLEAIERAESALEN